VDDQFVRVDDGRPVQMAGVNWFGFNNGMTWLNGLWAGGKSANSDFATIAYQLQLLVSGLPDCRAAPDLASVACTAARGGRGAA
jgi:hypothetical protein